MTGPQAVLADEDPDKTYTDLAERLRRHQQASGPAGLPVHGEQTGEWAAANQRAAQGYTERLISEARAAEVAEPRHTRKRRFHLPRLRRKPAAPVQTSLLQPHPVVAAALAARDARAAKVSHGASELTHPYIDLRELEHGTQHDADVPEPDGETFPDFVEEALESGPWDAADAEPAPEPEPDGFPSAMSFVPPIFFYAMGGVARTSRTCAWCAVPDNRDEDGWRYDALCKWSCPACVAQAWWSCPMLPVVSTADRYGDPGAGIYRNAEYRLIQETQSAARGKYAWVNPHQAGGWEALIPVGGRNRFLGCYADEYSARHAWARAMDTFVAAADRGAA